MTTHSRSNQPEKIHALTSLRFFAAVYIVLFHTLWMAIPSLTRTSLAGRILSLGYLAVDFFFLLSGYILAMVYLRNRQPVRKGSFYAARFARIYPLFFLTLVADTPALISERIAKYGWSDAVLKTAVTFLANVVMLQAWVPSLRGINNPNWSLSVETFFYLLFPYVGLWIWRLSGARVWIFGAGIWAGIQALKMIAAVKFGIFLDEKSPLLHVSTFVLGIFLAKWQSIRRERGGGVPVDEREAFPLLIAGVAGFGIVVHWQTDLSTYATGGGLMAPIFACIVWAFSINQSWPARLLSLKWLVILGEASFGLYLIHMPVYHLWESLHLDQIPALYPIYLATCIGLSLVSFYRVEAPLRRWILKRLQIRPKENMEAASDAQ